MKQLLPQNALLILAAVVMGLTAYYNLMLRHNFGLAVGYRMPQPPASSSQSASVQVQETEPPPLASEESLWEEYIASEEEPEEETVVLAKFPLDVNTATVEQLTYIPKIGNATAQRIVQYREHLGGYTQLIQLKDIKGIGDKTFETIAPYLYVQGEGDYVLAENSGEMD